MIRKGFIRDSKKIRARFGFDGAALYRPLYRPKTGLCLLEMCQPDQPFPPDQPMTRAIRHLGPFRFRDGDRYAKPANPT